MNKETNLTKEELATIESIDARLKRLEEIFNQQADPVIAAKEEQPKEVLPQAKEEFIVRINPETFGDYYYIQVANKIKGFTKEQAEKYQATIKNALNT